MAMRGKRPRGLGNPGEDNQGEQNNNQIEDDLVYHFLADDRWIYKKYKDCNGTTFNDTTYPKIAKYWYNQLEKIFEIMECTDAQKLKLTVFALEGDGHHWWKSVKRIQERRDQPLTWATFEEEFDTKYIPSIAKELKADEFLQLVQGSLSVAQYEAQFMQLA